MIKKNCKTNFILSFKRKEIVVKLKQHLKYNRRHKWFNQNQLFAAMLVCLESLSLSDIIKVKAD